MKKEIMYKRITYFKEQCYLKVKLGHQNQQQLSSLMLFAHKVSEVLNTVDGYTKVLQLIIINHQLIFINHEF